MVTVRYTPRLADRVAKAPATDAVDRPCRLDRVPRVRPHATRWSRTATSGARSPTRSTGTRSPSTCPRTCSWRRAASSRPRCRDIRRTSSRASIPTSRAALLAESGVEGTVRVAGLEDVGRHHRAARPRLDRGARPAGRDADVDARPGLAAAAPVGGVHRADRRHRLAPGLRRPGVLPAAAAAFRVEDERGRLRLRAVRRADRARAAGALGPRAARAVPRRRPDGGHRAGGVDPARLRAQRWRSSSRACTAGGSSASRRRRSPISWWAR